MLWFYFKSGKVPVTTTSDRITWNYKPARGA